MEAVVIDTNVAAYHLLGVEEHRDVLSSLFLSDLEFVAPQSLKAEILNVLWLAIRSGALTLEEAANRLDSVDRMVTRSIPIPYLWVSALTLAVQSDHSPYDTLFVAAAEREGSVLLTYDRRLKDAFPSTAVDPGAFLRKL
jgi:predicted nucleic acid-binding protein